MFFFSIKGAILNTADLVRKNYNTFDLLLFVREGKGSAFTSKFCCSSFSELPEIYLKFIELCVGLSWHHYFYAKPLIFISQNNFPSNSDGNVQVNIYLT